MKEDLPYLAPTDCHHHSSLFLWDEISSWGLGSMEGECFKSLLRLYLKHFVVQQKRMSPCLQVPVDNAVHSRGHLGIQKAKTALMYRDNHKQLVN